VGTGEGRTKEVLGQEDEEGLQMGGWW